MIATGTCHIPCVKGAEDKNKNHHPDWGIDPDHQKEIRLQSHRRRDQDDVRYPVVSLEQLLYFPCPSLIANTNV